MLGRVLIMVGVFSCMALHAADARPRLFARYADEQATLWRLNEGGSAGTALPAKLETPLGSLWKLFVYAYLDDRRITSTDYRCGGGNPEEVYCCQPGASVDRERALVRSCGLYFEPARLGLNVEDWRDYWRARQAPPWLADLPRLQPETRVKVVELLQALQAVPDNTRRTASETLVSVFTLGRGEDSLPEYGTRLRVKTWTMPDPLRPGASMGGAAGWAADGSPVWLSGPGGSAQVLSAAAPALSPLLDGIGVPDDGGCVVVDYFARYPLRELTALGNSAPARAGPLQGRYRVSFANGNHAEIESLGEMRLALQDGQPHITAQLGVNEYVARVLDREAAAEPREAARALAVVARSYLLQNAARQQGCFAIADSSAAQRVAPRPASRAARAVADWSDGLVLDGSEVQFHLNAAGRGRLSWTQAVADGAAGIRFDAILARSFAGASLSHYLSALGGDCQRLPEAEQWLAGNSLRWEARLARESGFEPPPLPAICALDMGRPRADAQRERIYAQPPRTQEARITLAHEYLHLAFAHHPRGQDEAFVEALARELVMGAQR